MPKDSPVPRTFLRCSLLPFLGLFGPMPPRYQCASQAPPTSLGCTLMVTGPRTTWAPKVVDYNPQFYPFLAIFQLLGARRLFLSWTFLGPPGCLRIPGVSRTFFRCSLLPSLGSFAVAFTRLRRTYKWHFIRLPRHECVSHIPGMHHMVPSVWAQWRPKSWIIIHGFSCFRVIFRLFWAR